MITDKLPVRRGGIDSHRTQRVNDRIVRGILVFVPLAALAMIAFYPILTTVYKALTGTSPVYDAEEGFGAVLLKVVRSEEFRSSLTGSVTIALTATAGCLVLGFILSLIISFIPFPGGQLLGRMIDAYLSFPSFLIALTFVFIYGRTGFVNSLLSKVLGGDPLGNFVNTRWALMFAMITFYTPFVMRPLLAAFSQIDAGLIESASVLGARTSRIVRRIIFPQAVPALLAGGSLTLVLTLNEFGIIVMMGVKNVDTLTLSIYTEAIVTRDETVAAVMALANVCLSLGMYAIYRIVVNRGGGGDKNADAFN